MKKNIYFITSFIVALSLIVGCEQASNSNETENTENTEQESEKVQNDLDVNETPNEATDVPQTVDQRIAEIKAMYAQVQASQVTNAECRTNSVKDVSYDMIDIGFETVNTAKECPLEDGLMYQRVEMNGYEWGETTTFYSKNGVRFFAFTSGGAEGCGYEYRVYYDKEGEVIRVLLSENDCDGKEVSAPVEITSEGSKSEILKSIAAAEKEFNSILN